MLKDFYTPFHELIEKSGDIDRSSVSQTRELGIDPKSGLPIITRFGRFGPMLQMGETTTEEKPRFAPLPKGTRLETVTLEQALEMFKLPRIVGQTPDGKDIKANIGRFGPYVQVEKEFFSIKGFDPMTIDLSEAQTIIDEITEKRKPIKVFDDGTTILNGPYGPYIKKGDVNARIPKNKDPLTITEYEAAEMISNAPKKKSRFTKKSSTKNTPTKKASTRKKSTTKKKSTKK
jgi:DNA topoisomerase-1